MVDEIEDAVSASEIARVNELDDEVARLTGELEKANHTARDYMRQRDSARAELDRWQTGTMIEGDYIRANGEVVGDPYAAANRWHKHYKISQASAAYLSAEVKRMRDVVEAARRWRKGDSSTCNRELVDAVDAFDGAASEQQTKGGDAHEPGPRTSEAGPRQVTSPAPDSTSAAGVSGAPLAAVAMALEETGRLLAMGGHSPNTPHLFAQRARELREGK